MKYLYAAIAIASALAAAVLTYMIMHSIQTAAITKLNTAHAAALEFQKDVLVSECQDSKRQTEETSHAYQTTIASITADRDRINNRLRLAERQTCVVLQTASGPSNGSNAAARPDRIPVTVGVEAGTVIDEAAACDENTAKLIGLQGWINKLYDTP